MKLKKSFPYPLKICSICGKEVSQTFQNLLREDKKPICQKCMYPAKNVKNTVRVL